LLASTNQNFLQSPKTKYKCNVCKDTGSVLFLVEDECVSTPEEKVMVERWGDCDCLKEKKYRDMYERAGISKIFENCTFKNFTLKGKPAAIKTAKQTAEDFVKEYDGKHSIAFLGQVGSGKTHLCIAIANELLKKLVGVLYMQYREVLTQLKQNITDDEFYQKEIHKYKTAPVLYIDDLYKGKITDSDKNIIFEIINYRYLNMRPIIISTEFSCERLLDFDEAIGSRIIQMCKGYIIELSGLDLNHRLL